MKIKVNPHFLEIKEKEKVNENEINVSDIKFEFSKEITEDFIKEAYFTNFNGESYKVLIQNDKCNYPQEIIKYTGKIEIGVVAFKVDENENTIIRYNPTPITKYIEYGSLKDAENSEPVTPTDKEQMEQALNDGLNDIAEAVENAEKLDIDAEKVEDTTTITITKQDGSTKSVDVLDGTDGQDGQDGVSLEYKWAGTSLGIKREDEQNYDYTNLKGDKGEPGQIEFTIVNQLPQTGSEGIIYLVPYTTIIVQELPSTGTEDTIYIVESTNKRYVYESGQWVEITDDNKYIEYIYVNNKWEKLGGINVDIDLSNYYTKQEVNNLIPDELSDLRDDSTHRLTTDTEKTTWNNKYAKPIAGIPKNDLASDVQTSLGKADTALQSETDPVFSASASANITSSDITNWNNKQNALTFDTAPTSGSTNPVTSGGIYTYVNNIVGDIETILTTLDVGSGV